MVQMTVQKCQQKLTRFILSPVQNKSENRVVCIHAFICTHYLRLFQEIASHKIESLLVLIVQRIFLNEKSRFSTHKKMRYFVWISNYCSNVHMYAERIR